MNLNNNKWKIVWEMSGNLSSYFWHGDHCDITDYSVNAHEIGMKHDDDDAMISDIMDDLLAHMTGLDQNRNQKRAKSK
jgi:hypothetical protein